MFFSKFDSHFFEVRQKVAQILQGVLGQQISHLDVLLDAQEHDVGVQLGDCILELVLFQCLGAEFTVRQIVWQYNIQIERNQVNKLHGVGETRQDRMLVYKLLS